MEPVSEEKREAIRRQAWACYQRGWTVIATKGKRPAIRSWKKYQRQRPTQAEFAEMFGPSSDFDGLAVILGNASDGLACRDFDAAAAYADWAKDHPHLAASLPTVSTGRGFHVYFRTEKEGYKVFRDGEFRASRKQYCVLPPSRHPSGSFYTWTIPLQDKLPILDPYQAGLCPPASSAETQRTQRTHDTHDSHDIQTSPPPPSCPVSSASSVSSVSSLSEAPFGLEIEEAISQTLPNGVGQRNHCMFALARLLKAMASYADADPRSLRPILQEWHRRALTFIRTKPFDTTWFEFLNAWPQIDYPAGTGPLDKALRRAHERLASPVVLRYEEPKLQLLVALVAELQRMAGEKPFFLSCRTAGKLIGVDFREANTWLRGLVLDGVLELVSKGENRSKKASQYRYLLDLAE